MPVETPEPRDFSFRRLLSRDPGAWTLNIIAGNVAQVVDDRLSIDHSSSEANVAIRSNQDQRVSGDAIGAVGVPIAIDQRVVGARGHVACARDSICAQEVMVGSGQLWRGLISESEQREVRAMEEIEEPDLLIAPGTDAGRIGGAIPGANACCAIQVAGQRTAPVGDTQLTGIGEGLLAREERFDSLAEIALVLSMAGGSGGQNALSDGKTFGLIGVQQSVGSAVQHLSQLPAPVHRQPNGHARRRPRERFCQCDSDQPCGYSVAR